MEPDTKLDKHLKLTEKSLSLFFYKHKVMPCCMNPKKYLWLFSCGTKDSNYTNIQCFHCGHKWNINEKDKFIEDGEKETPRLLIFPLHGENNSHQEGFI